MNRRLIAGLASLLCLAGVAKPDALDRLKLDQLEKVHADVVKLAAARQAPAEKPPFRDLRAILHAHSAFSHDSRGKIEDIVAAAKKAGVNAILFTEHPAKHYDYVNDGHRGLRDGVLLIPGAETGGFLAYPAKSLKDVSAGSPQDFADLVKRTGGRIFLCHLEERMDWRIAGLTGSEIYNTHADVKDEKRFMTAIFSPLYWFTLSPAVQRFPQETYAALQDYPANYLKRFDQLCLESRLMGVAGNDAHQNIGLVVKLIEGDKVRLEDALGKKIVDLPAKQIPLLAPLVKDKKVGDVVFNLQLDPYETAFRHVSTHVFAKELTDQAVWEALEAGRGYVSFDWICDPTGFDFYAQTADGRKEMGSRPTWSSDLALVAAAPLDCQWRVFASSKEKGSTRLVHESTGRALRYSPPDPGNYRVECWLPLAGERRPWILSNPIYLAAPAN